MGSAFKGLINFELKIFGKKIFGQCIWGCAPGTAATQEEKTGGWLESRSSGPDGQHSKALSQNNKIISVLNTYRPFSCHYSLKNIINIQCFHCNRCSDNLDDLK